MDKAKVTRRSFVKRATAGASAAAAGLGGLASPAQAQLGSGEPARATRPSTDPAASVVNQTGPRIGYLSSHAPHQHTPSAPVNSPEFRATNIGSAFELGMTDVGLNSQTDVRREYGNDFRGVYQAAQNLLNDTNIRVIYAADSYAAHEALRARDVAAQERRDVPIVFGVSGSPVDQGLVDNAQMPGTGVTGMDDSSWWFAVQMWDCLAAVIKPGGRIGIVGNADHRGIVKPNAGANNRLSETVQNHRRGFSAAVWIGLRIPDPAQSIPDIGTQLNQALQQAGQVRALIFLSDPLVNWQAERTIIPWLINSKLPNLFGQPQWPEKGALMALGTDRLQLARDAVRNFLRPILDNTVPVIRPVERPPALRWVINRQRLQALALAEPRNVPGVPVPEYVLTTSEPM